MIEQAGTLSHADLLTANAQLRARVKEQEDLKDSWRRVAERLEGEKRELERQLAELLALVGTETPIAAFDLATTWQAEKAHMMDAYKEAVGDVGELRAALEMTHNALSATVQRISGYNWNADPDQMTLLQGDAFAAYARVSSNGAES